MTTKKFNTLPASVGNQLLMRTATCPNAARTLGSLVMV